MSHPTPSAALGNAIVHSPPGGRGGCVPCRNGRGGGEGRGEGGGGARAARGLWPAGTCRWEHGPPAAVCGKAAAI